jgi:Tol biopolymer transport system component
MNQLYAWGPGSDQIFLCSGGGLFSVAVNGDTTPQHLVDAFSFSVAPDGVHIAYATWPAQAPTAVIRIRDLLTNEDQYLIDGGWPAWSPDGKFVAYLTDQGVNAVEIESGRVAVIDADSAAARNLYAPLSWSPDSSAIAYSKGGVIYLKDVASKEAVHAVAEGYSPVLSSDGLGLTYHVGFSCEDVYIAPVDRSAPPMRIGDGYHSAWSPDGSKIVSARPSYYTNCEPITR